MSRICFDFYHGAEDPHCNFIQWISGYWYLSHGLPIKEGILPNGDRWMFIGWTLSKIPIADLIGQYNKVGAEALFHADGEFVCLKYSSAMGFVEICRDRLGILPIAYAQGPKGIALSTRKENVIDLSGVEKVPSKTFLAQYPVYRVAIVPESPFEGVKYLSGRSSLRITNNQIKEMNENLPSDSSRKYNSMKDASSDLGHCLSVAVRNRIDDNRKLGAWLSGGNDSSIIVALMREHTAAPIKTVFVTFDDYKRNYGGYARFVSERYDTDHVECVVALKEYLNNWAETISLIQSPINHPGSVGQTVALKEVSGMVDVMLAGEGADSVFGGPYWAPMILLSSISKYLPATLRKIAHIWSGGIKSRSSLSKALSKGLKALGTPLNEYVLVGHAFGDEESTDNIFGQGTWQNAIHACRGYIHENPLVDLIFFLLLDWFPATISVDMCRGFHYGITFRFPFFDYELLNKSLRLPVWLRYHYLTKKAPLKRFSLNYFDHSFVHKPKEGLGVPLGQWLARPEFEPFLYLPLEERSLKRGWWSEKLIKPLMEYHKSGQGSDESAEVIPWITMNLELWARVCLEGDSPDLYKIPS
jgi:asparagine synthase (glutamine-hydrolysing)